MFRAISAEFLKFRRSKLLLLIIISGILPSIIKFLQLSFSNEDSNPSWEKFLTSGKEIQVLGILITIILVAGFLINMEYQYKTISYILSSSVSKSQIYLSKMISLLLVISLLLFISGLSELVFGFLLIKATVSGSLLIKLVQVTLLYIASYFLLSAMVLMLGALTKRFIITSVIALGLFMMTFPFQLKHSIYACPFMTPAAVASKIYRSDYIFNNAYKDVIINNLSVIGFLLAIGVISTMIGLIIYKKSDAIS